MSEENPVKEHIEFTEVPKNGIGMLIGALAKAQTEFKPIIKDTINPFYKNKYADLATIIAATQPSLAKNGLAVIQIPKVDEQAKQAGVITILAHSSGQTIESELLLPAAQGTKFDAQTVGSALTYSRRYAMQSILGVSADADDDGNAAANGSGSREAAKEVGEQKVKDLKEKAAKAKNYTPALFYTWFNESQTAKIEGDADLMTTHRELLKKHWNPMEKAIVVNAEQLEDLKYHFEKIAVPFKLLKSVGENLTGQLEESIKELNKKKATNGQPNA